MAVSGINDRYNQCATCNIVSKAVDLSRNYGPIEPRSVIHWTVARGRARDKLRVLTIIHQSGPQSHVREVYIYPLWLQ